MKETKVFLWCDNHWPELLEAAGTRTIAFDGGPPRGLDLCEQCEKDLLTPLTELLEGYGQIPGAPSVPTQTRRVAPAQASAPGDDVREVKGPCQICQQPMQRHSLIGHIYAKHSSVTMPKGVTVCPDCGYTAKVQGVGAHRMAKHGYDPLLTAYAAAQANPK